MAGTSTIDHFVFAQGDTGVAITGFVSATDKVNLDALDTNGINSFGNQLSSTTANYYMGFDAGYVFLVTGGSAGAADSAAGAATLISKSAYWVNSNSGTVAYFVVVDDNSSAIYKYTEKSAPEAAESELSLVGTIDAVTVAGDYLFQ